MPAWSSRRVESVKRPVVLMSLAGLLVFLGVLVLYLPASWFSAVLPASVKCSELGGSIWNGECLGLELQGSRLGDATWNFAAGKAFTGHARGDVAVRGPALNARADLDVGLNGGGELRDVTATFPLDPAFIAKFPRNQRGTNLPPYVMSRMKPSTMIPSQSGHILGSSSIICPPLTAVLLTCVIHYDPPAFFEFAECEREFAMRVVFIAGERPASEDDGGVF